MVYCKLIVKKHKKIEIPTIKKLSKFHDDGNYEISNLSLILEKGWLFKAEKQFIETRQSGKKIEFIRFPFPFAVQVCNNRNIPIGFRCLNSEYSDLVDNINSRFFD